MATIDKNINLKNESLIQREEHLGVISHDLKNPLTSILLNTQMILRTSKILNQPELMLKIVERIQKTAEKMSLLVDDILTTRKVASDSLNLELKPHRIFSVLKEIDDVMEPLMTKKEIRFLQLVDAPENTLAIYDPIRIFQVLSNLLGNAIKFTPVGGFIVLHITEESEKICFAVTDSGRGIPNEQISEVFNRYWKSKESDGGGTGLGLTISKEIVGSHGGTIWVKSEAGKGSTFSFTLKKA